MKKIILLAALSIFFFACESEDAVLEESLLKEVNVKSPTLVDIGSTTHSISLNKASTDKSTTAQPTEVAVLMAEYITSGEEGEMGNTVFFMNVGNKQLSGDFVSSLTFDGTDDISYYVDDNRPSSDLNFTATNNAIDRAMDTWDGVTCSDIGMYEVSFNGRETGYIAKLLSNIVETNYGIPNYFGGSYQYVADVTHAGWMPALFFNFLAPGGSRYILGVTFTIIFTDGNGNPVDTDNNGKYDVAWREIYYNDRFNWNDGNHYDVETIALHESGHGLSQGHFGKAFRSNGNGELHFSPRAVMNAAYSGIQTSIENTDESGHCSNWAQWPNN